MTWKWFATIKKLIKMVGFDFEKNGPSRLENYAKMFKKCKMAKITFLGTIGIPEVACWGFLGLVCIEKLIQAPKVPFLVPP